MDVYLTIIWFTFFFHVVFYI